jgi:hypothetical protein
MGAPARVRRHAVEGSPIPSIGRRRTVRALLSVALAIACLGSAGTGSSLALFVDSRTASSNTLTTTTLAAPTNLRVVAGTYGSATLTWNAVTVTSPGAVLYYVLRDGAAPAGNCPTAAAPAAVLTCVDRGLSSAQHSYTVASVYGGWTATSATARVTISGAPTVSFSSKLAADGYIAVTIPGSAFPANTKISISYWFGSTTPINLGDWNLNPTSNGSGAFTVTFEDNCLDGDQVQWRVDKTVTVKASDGTNFAMGTGTIVCSLFKL